MQNLDFQVEMIGRDDELKELQQYLYKVEEGQGNTVFISGEAGIGKTRLINELKKIAESKGFQILFGNSMFESLTPYMPFLDALKSGGLDYLFEEEAPRVEAVYLVTHSGVLIKEVMRQGTDLNPNIFASMLTAVGNFVKESLSSLSEGEKEGTLNTLGYENYRILIESGKNANLAVLLKGKENEFLIDDLNKTFQKVEKYYGSELKKWDGNVEKMQGIEKILELLITSGKYDGIYYGKEDPKVRRNLLFENVSMGLARYAQSAPTILCIEDLQWADPSTLALIHYIARNTKKAGLLILSTYRPEDIASEEGNVHPLINTMQLMDQETLYNKVQLQRLIEDKMAEFLFAMFGETDFDDNFLNRIYKETEGNPLFLIQLLKFLVEEGIIEKDNGTWKLAKDFEDADIPFKIYNVILRRLNRIEKQNRRILDYASVIGEVFEPRVLADSLDIESSGLVRQLKDVEQNHKLIYPLNGQYKFDHAKVKEVLYNEIPQELRKEYHAIIANSIETLKKDHLEGVIGDLAFHYYHCKNKEKALFYLLKAAEKARGDYSNEEAIRFYKHALEFEDDAKMRLGIFESIGDIYSLIGEYSKGVDWFNKGLKMADKKKKAEIKVKIGGILEKKGEFDESIRFCYEALDLVEGEECREKAIALKNIGNAQMQKGNRNRAIEHYENGLNILEEIGEKEDIAVLLRTIGVYYANMGELNRALEYLEKSLELYKEFNDQQGIAASLNDIGLVVHQRGDLLRALELLEKSLNIDEKIGDQQDVAICLHNIGWIQIDLGELDRSLENCEKSYKIAKKIGFQPLICSNYIGIGEAYFKKGDLKKALESCNRAFELSKKIGRKEIMIGVNELLGSIYREQKNWKKSIESFEKSIKMANELGHTIAVAAGNRRFGLMWKEKGDYEIAKTYLKEALKIYKKMKAEKKVKEVEAELLFFEK